MHRLCVLFALLLAACSNEGHIGDAGKSPTGADSDVQGGGADASCMCAEPGKILLDLCSAGAQQVQSTAATGGACQTSGLQVQLVQEGSCHVTITFKDSTTYSFDATVSRDPGDCCPGLYPDGAHMTVTVPYAGCPGSCGNDGGC